MLNDVLVFLLISAAITEVCLGSSSVVSCVNTVLGIQNHNDCDSSVPSYLTFCLIRDFKSLVLGKQRYHCFMGDM